MANDTFLKCHPHVKFGPFAAVFEFECGKMQRRVESDLWWLH
jgi:hypothetical protein